MSTESRVRAPDHPSLVLADWDNTLRRGFTVRDWARYLADRQLYDARALERLEDLLAGHASGEVKYAELAVRAGEAYAEGLHGVSTEEVRLAATGFVRLDLPNLFGYTRELLLMLQNHGLTTCIISGCPQPVLDAYRDHLPWDSSYGLDAVSTESGRYSSSVKLNPASAPTKREIAARVVGRGQAALALGDSEADLPLFAHASRAVVVDNAGLAVPNRRVLRLSSSESVPSVLREVRGIISSTGGEVSGGQ